MQIFDQNLAKSVPIPTIVIPILLGVASLTLHGQRSLAAQVTVDPGAEAIEGQGSCRTRCFEIEHLHTIGGRFGDAMLPGLNRFAFDTQDRIFIAAAEIPGELWVYDRAGNLVETMTNVGEGPGELQRIDWILVGPGDSLHIFDRLNARYNVFAPNLTWIRSSPFPGLVTDAVSLTDGKIALSARIATPEAVGLPLHILDREGSLIKSFGASQGFFRSGMERSLERRLTPSNDSGFWSVSRTTYVIERWDPDGERTAAYRRIVDWFEPYFRARSVTPEDPPLPSVNSIHQDSQGLLWILSLVPEDNYVDGLRRTDTPEGVGYAYETPENIFATRIEVINPKTRDVLVSQRVPRMYGMLIQDGIMMGISVDELGVQYIDLYHISLTEGDES